MSETGLDFERYRHHAEGLNMPSAQVDAAIAAMHRLMQHFVDMAFGDGPVRLSVEKSAKKLGGTQEEHAILPAYSTTVSDADAAPHPGRGEPDSRLEPKGM